MERPSDASCPITRAMAPVKTPEANSFATLSQPIPHQDLLANDHAKHVSTGRNTKNDSAFTLCQVQVRKQGASSAGRSLHRAAGAAAQQPHRPRRSQSFDSLDLQLTQKRRLDDRMHCMLRAMLARPITRTASHARLCSFGTKASVSAP